MQIARDFVLPLMVSLRTANVLGLESTSDTHEEQGGHRQVRDPVLER